MNKAALPPIPSKEIDLNSDTTIEPGLAQCFIAALEIALDQLSILEDIPPKISGTENKQVIQ